MPAMAAASNADYYPRAFKAIAAGHAEQAQNFATHGPDPILNKVVRSYAMALPGNDYSFEQMDQFITANPHWPGLKGIQMIAEQKIPQAASNGQIVGWFSTHPPVTMIGFYRYIDALNQSGQAQAAQKAIIDRWTDTDFSSDEQTAFYERFRPLLGADAMWERTDHLLWKNNTTAAKRMLPFLPASYRAVAEARIALTLQDKDSAAYLSRVPAEVQNDPGLLYQRLRWFVRDNRDEDADEFLLNAPVELGNPELWWEQRQIMIRRAIERRDYALAYELAHLHGQNLPKNLTQAEFLSGWLALRFLDKPQAALAHFQKLYDGASTPVTRARGAYWIGRTCDVLDNKSAAHQAYEDAAIFNTTFYGQLAAARLSDKPLLTAKADPPLPEAQRHAVMSNDLVRAAEKLAAVGETQRMRSFFRAAIDDADTRPDFIMLAEVATRMHHPELGIQVVKAAAQKDILVENGGFPMLALKVPPTPEPAFTHALIRQESMFDPEAESVVGAQGLMQLMPRTAKEVARREGVRYSPARLKNPAYNIQLGTAFVQQQIDHFNGSYILALAGYNAGPSRVREWIATYGDPRSADVDDVDWIELMPIQETRNYVERIIESLQVYRAKLAHGQAPLLIINDLKR